MAVIYLRHPIHGAKVACSDLEAQHDMNLGWEVFDPTAPAEPEPVVAVNHMLGRRRRKEPQDATVL